MQIHQSSKLSRQEVNDLCRRNPVHDRELITLCEDIFKAVEERGDDAVREFTERFDGVVLDNLRVQPSEFTEALERQPEEVTEALHTAMRNLKTFHSSQQLSEKPVDVQEGVKCWRAARAIRSVGLYVPGGTAVLPSTVLMLAIPAKLAGCPKVVLCVPPQADGSVSDVVLAAAHLSGVRQVFKVGGAQAIAAMALGTESIPCVAKILGPGNRYVQTAKLVATFYETAIDMVAGPSEVLVIAADGASPSIVASDLISQAEHGVDSQVVLVSPSSELVESVNREIAFQLDRLPRMEIAREALEQSFAVIVESLDEAFDFSNNYAPEHLILAIDNPRDWLGRVYSAGSVFVGEWSPEVAGDYASGTNHTLPTAGTARNVSGVSIDSFVKKITFQELTPQGLESLAPTLETLARVESLEGHARAVTYRLKKLKEAGQ
jgi:histidinol dehydrogenase